MCFVTHKSTAPECTYPEASPVTPEFWLPLPLRDSGPATASWGPKPSSSSRHLWSEAGDPEYLIHTVHPEFQAWSLVPNMSSTKHRGGKKKCAN